MGNFALETIGMFTRSIVFAACGLCGSLVLWGKVTNESIVFGGAALHPPRGHSADEESLLGGEAIKVHVFGSHDMPKNFGAKKAV
jgi:hypothetical protein